MFTNKIIDHIAKYYVELGGCDAIIFTAGVGENGPDMRKDVLDRLSCLGIKVDVEKNNETRLGKEGLISSEDSTVPCYVIPTDEEVMIARDTFELVD